MSQRAALTHITHYQYDRPVQLSPQLVRLCPAPHCRSRVVSYALTVTPTDHLIHWHQDPFANHQVRLIFPSKTSELIITVDLELALGEFNPFDFFLEPSAEYFPFAYSAQLAQDLAPYLVTAPLSTTPLLRDYLGGRASPRQRTVDFLVALNQHVSQDVSYTTRDEPGVQDPEQTLASKVGSCRDSAWLMVQLLRHHGLAARFVSGYLIELTPDEATPNNPLNHRPAPAEDHTELHAWCEVYLPGAGWIGFDTTSGLLTGQGHIPLACTPQTPSAAPIEGAVEPAKVSFSHRMTVRRILA